MRILISSRALVFIRHFHISHNAPYSPPPAPPQILHKQFLLGRMYANFFLVGGGGSVVNEVHQGNVEVAYATQRVVWSLGQERTDAIISDKYTDFLRIFCR